MPCTMFCWKWPSGSGEEAENVKTLQKDRQTDAGQKIYKRYDIGEINIKDLQVTIIHE